MIYRNTYIGYFFLPIMSFPFYISLYFFIFVWSMLNLFPSSYSAADIGDTLRRLQVRTYWCLWPQCLKYAVSLFVCYTCSLNTSWYDHKWYLNRFPFSLSPYTHTRTHARTHAHTTACTHARTHARTHAHTHARTHACTHARMHARMHRHTHDRWPKIRRERVWVMVTCSKRNGLINLTEVQSGGSYSPTGLNNFIFLKTHNVKY